MNPKTSVLIVFAIVISFIAGFWVANSLNRTEINQMRSTSAAKTPESPDEQIDTKLSLKEISDRIAEADQNPTDISYQKNLGLALYRYAGMRQDPELLLEVSRILERVYQSDQKDYDVLVSLGHAYFDAGLLKKDDQTFRKSQKFYREAIAIDSKDLDISADLGLTYTLAIPPDMKKGIEIFKETLKKNANHEKTLQGIVQAYAAENNSAEAENYFATLEKVNPQNPRLAELRNQLKGIGTEK